MRLWLTRSRDLSGSSEVLDGILVLRIRYGPALASRLRGGVLIQKLLQNLYKKAVKSLPSNVPCAVVVEAASELEDLGLIRAVIGLWDIVTNSNARLILVGYPTTTVSGRKAPMPPMLPNFGLARDMVSGLKWIGQPELDIEGGDAWSTHPGVSRGRSLLPGERYPDEDPESEGKLPSCFQQPIALIPTDEMGQTLGRFAKVVQLRYRYSQRYGPTAQIRPCPFRFGGRLVAYGIVITTQVPQLGTCAKRQPFSENLAMSIGDDLVAGPAGKPAPQEGIHVTSRGIPELADKN